MYLIFDCSALSMPSNFRANVEDTYHWPRMVHLAWEIFDSETNIIASKNYLIKPAGFDISSHSSEWHGVQHEEAKEKGAAVCEVLKEFAQDVKQAQYVLAFNLEFNEKIVGAEFFRCHQANVLVGAETLCLMRESTYYCRLAGKDGRYKWPTLQQLFHKCFGVQYEGANQADKDVRAAAMCFFKLLEEEALDL